MLRRYNNFAINVDFAIPQSDSKHLKNVAPTRGRLQERQPAYQGETTVFEGSPVYATIVAKGWAYFTCSLPHGVWLRGCFPSSAKAIPITTIRSSAGNAVFPQNIRNYPKIFPSFQHAVRKNADKIFRTSRKKVFNICLLKALSTLSAFCPRKNPTEIQHTKIAKFHGARQTFGVFRTSRKYYFFYCYVYIYLYLYISAEKSARQNNR